MVNQSGVLPQEAIDWAKTSVLYPHLDDLLAEGKLNPPSRFTSREEAFAAIGRVLEEQMRFLQEGKRQTITGLAEATERSGSQVHEILASVVDYGALLNGLRFRESDQGRIELDESAFVIKTYPSLAHGPNVFGACSPAYPKEVRGVLEMHGIPTGSQRPQDDATDSTAYLVESSPKLEVALASAVLTEGSQWDQDDVERYPPELREEIGRALVVTAGGHYEVDTKAILRKEVFEPFFAGRAKYASEARGRLPIESGWISCGIEGERHRFLGGELDMIRYLQKGGFAPFLDIPRNLVPGLSRGPVLDCTFRLGDREIPAGWLTWAAKVAFGAFPSSRRFNGVFRLVDDAAVAMAGANLDHVEYAVAMAGVGKRGSTKRLGMGLLIRNEDGMLSGWGIPGLKKGDDLSLRTSIEQAEQHIARMRPDGAFQRTVERLQAAGLQHTGVKLADYRKRREGLILAGDVLRQRALLHL